MKFNLQKSLFLFTFLATTLFASSGPYDLRLAYGAANEKPFGEIITGTAAPSPYKTHVMSLDGGYRIAHNFYGFPFDIYIKAGLSKFLENGYKKDVYENTLYLKGYYKFNFWGNQVRLGAGEGVSYTYGTLYVEYQDALKNNGHTSNFLNYLDMSLDFDVGRLIHSQQLKYTYIGVLLHHRSGIFGLINNVRRGGSNFVSYYVEKNF
jgi:hypothetical protein